MLNHTGHKCAFCHKPFQKGDDVVVCPECGAPYHRSCYQEAGQCVFTDQHGADFEWKPEPPAEGEQEELICPNCGASTPADSQFCKHCGAKIQIISQDEAPAQEPTAEEKERWNWQLGQYAEQFSPNDTMYDIPLKDWVNFIGRSAPYYLVNFKHMELTGRRVGFSFSAMMFGPIYFFFRKMWKWGLIFFGAQFLLSLPTLLYILAASGSAYTAGLSVDALVVLMSVASFLNFILIVARSLFAGSLYRNHVLRKLRAIHQQFPDDAQRVRACSVLGGTSMIGALLYFVGQTMLYSLLLLNLSGPNLMSVLYSMMYS